MEFMKKNEEKRRVQAWITCVIHKLVAGWLAAPGRGMTEYNIIIL